MHTLTVGNSGTGKSNLMKRLALEFEKQGRDVIVYDPLAATGWPLSATKFSSPEKFLDYIKTAKSAHVFIDEAKTLWDFDQKQADQILFRRRHQGLLVHLIAQRTRMVPPNARNQCSRVFAFKQQKDDAITLAEEYTGELLQCARLEKGEYIASDGFSAHFFRLDYSRGLPPEICKVGTDIA